MKKALITGVEIDPKYYRPSEVDLLVGDPGKAKRVLGWESKIKFKDLVQLMVEADMEAAGIPRALRAVQFLREFSSVRD